MAKVYSIEEIIIGCRKKQAAYQRALVNMYSDRLFAICLRYLKDKDLAKDALQDSLIRVFKYIESFDSNKASIYTWMSTITVRACLKNLDKKKIELVSYDELPSEERGFDPSPLDALSTRELITLVNELPDGYREVFNLAVIDGFSHQEIGDLLGLSSGASRSRLSRAKDILRKKISLIQRNESWINIS